MAQRMSTCFVMRNLIGRADKPVVITSEGGRATLAATCDREDRIIQHLRARFGHVSVERALSGPGLENIYRAIGAVDKVATALQNAAQITKSALRGECHVAVEALNVFCAFLGSFAGNVALTFDARGGVYIVGGISPRIVGFMRRSQFRVRFEGKGRFQQNLKRAPDHASRGSFHRTKMLTLSAGCRRDPIHAVSARGPRLRPKKRGARHFPDACFITFSEVVGLTGGDYGRTRRLATSFVDFG
jgi:glucokinase